VEIIWRTLAQLIGLCFLEEISSLLIQEERLGKAVRLTFGLIFLIMLLNPLWQLLKLSDLLLEISLEGLVQ